MEEKILNRGWRYELKSALRTFLAFFIIVLAAQIKDIDVHEVGTSLVTGGIAASIRSLFTILIEPLAVSAWSAFVQLFQAIAQKVR